MLPEYDKVVTVAAAVAQPPPDGDIVKTEAGIKVNPVGITSEKLTPVRMAAFTLVTEIVKVVVPPNAIDDAEYDFWTRGGRTAAAGRDTPLIVSVTVATMLPFFFSKKKGIKHNQRIKAHI